MRSNINEWLEATQQQIERNIPRLRVLLSKLKQQKPGRVEAVEGLLKSVGVSLEPPTIRKVSHAVVNDQVGRFLILKRVDGHWDIPGGSVEDAETPLRAAVRELCEETGLVALPHDELPPFYAAHYKDPNTILECYHYFVRVVMAANKPIRLRELEHTEHIWEERRALPAYNFLPVIKNNLNLLFGVNHE